MKSKLMTAIMAGTIAALSVSNPVLADPPYRPGAVTVHVGHGDHGHAHRRHDNHGHRLGHRLGHRHHYRHHPDRDDDGLEDLAAGMFLGAALNGMLDAANGPNAR